MMLIKPIWEDAEAMKKFFGRNLDGNCPKCGCYTTAGDSCCGFGARVEGSVITDEQVQEWEDEENENAG